ncbi:hypothetical protein VCHA29O37_160042 [Vibrio chagasii]|nr:hypothetical protein VCHA29O37_160042 [Vibrio chagasii]
MLFFIATLLLQIAPLQDNFFKQVENIIFLKLGKNPALKVFECLHYFTILKLMIQYN